MKSIYKFKLKEIYESFFVWQFKIIFNKYFTKVQVFIPDFSKYLNSQFQVTVMCLLIDITEE